MRLWLVVILQALFAALVFSQTTSTIADSTCDYCGTVTPGTDETSDPTATTGTSGTGETSDPTATTGSPGTNTTDGDVETTNDLPHEDCYLCVPTVQCGETIDGDYSSAEVNVLFMKPMEDGDYFIVKGEVFPNAQKIFFDVFKDLYIGQAQIGIKKQPTLIQFEHYYDTNLTFSRSGLHNMNEMDSFRPAILPLPIREKKPWTLMFKMHENQTGFETGDETGWFNNHIPWNGTATTQSFNIRGGWKTTSVQFFCANSTLPIL